ncbi:GlxA family transcriptional regulator [Pseudoteredinibacter isoporae]|uniref:Transcriptional regulator GlxA family with amidase domain n=1 Tax=Pseudoteredinibacter isoporae TaxID=570281 RepID=A0A7X0JQ57_9GAMM|nr:helix-turn-helix domain-containing protein [Pseudoteredinibacter isoporae]MBB6520239.1 transcriptional regulator GlxA family with amidase domain [Pseudoteredinibacter isoporae]NHO85811.1 helix-turn-helix domain-containing protein [Pseudoteredinibacter isoporae]NIB25737.1 helix-turn-helix domain-containing protein [Pseudoteredinibacter isoporae]
MSNSAKQIYILCYPGFQLLDVAGPADVFAQANEELGRTVYELHYIAEQEKLSSASGLHIVCEPLSTCRAPLDYLFVPGANAEPLFAASERASFIAWLAQHAARANTLCSVCSGSLLLAKAGLLEGKRITSHWAALSHLQQMCPASTVLENNLYVNDGQLWTSAGVLAGVDMALALVARDHNHSLALKIAKNLLAFMFRDGHQPQLSLPISLQEKASDTSLLRLIKWLQDNLAEPINVEKMADYMATSVRSLHRYCQENLQLSPAKLFNELRLEQAKTLLGDKDIPIKQIASECGFADSSAFSKAFSQRHQLSPLQYRHRLYGA